MAPLAGKHLTADVARGRGENQVKAAYGSHDQCLVAMKRTYDPPNLFHLNQNITPTA
jgi:FAD/FMN-containing dehydrogenase